MEAKAWWQEINEQFACDHIEQRIVKYQQATGQWRVRKQCTCCGDFTTSDLKMAGYNLNELPKADYTLRDRRYAERNDAYKGAQEKAHEAYLNKAQEEDSQWWGKYTKYLLSREWHDIRKRVLERDKYVCQSCLRNKATQVHHTSYATYNEAGWSAAFELVSICYKCHRALHPHMADAQHDLFENQYNPYLQGERA